MENSSVSLCCVVGGAVYEQYALQLYTSFSEYFFPGSEQVFYHAIPGEEGWPNGTMYRWHRLLENMPDTDYIFLCDADMRFESRVRTEILSDAITVTLHPGYVGVDSSDLPYERRIESCCYMSSGDRYYAGGFVGGPRKQLKRFANEIVSRIDYDMSQGIVPCWHDESALNKVASIWRDLHILSPSYCYPDNDSYYKTFWQENYERKLVALDKTKGERGSRD